MNRSFKVLLSMLAIISIILTAAGCSSEVVNEAAEKQASAVTNKTVDDKNPGTTNIEGLIADDPNIQFEGALEIDRSPKMIKVRRFTTEVLNKVYPDPNFSTKNADTTSGIVMRFKTSSKKITAYFTALPLLADKERGVEFAVYRDNQLYKEYKFSNDVKTAKLDIESSGEGSVTYEITFPSWANYAFSGLALDPGKSVEKLPEEKKLKYAALGDSITHAANQGPGTSKSYPYILSRKFGWELYNFAVGGSRVAPEIGEMLKIKQFDVITILIGYNDWNGNNNKPEYERDLNQLINNIRKSQPKSKIFCITPTASKAQMNGKKTYTLDDYRQVVRDIVKERNEKGDNNIFVINGEEITTEKDLLDLVHLNYNGAKNFADKLYEKISQILGDTPK